MLCCGHTKTVTVQLLWYVGIKWVYSLQKTMQPFLPFLCQRSGSPILQFLGTN